MSLLALVLACLPQASPAPPPHLDEAELRRVDQALARGRAWLLAQQAQDGSFTPAHAGRDRVALTAMALWALADAPDADRPALEKAARFLLAHRQEDGGIYAPGGGLAVYTSGVASQALATLGLDGAEEAATLARLELFVYRAPTPESLADAEHDAERRPDAAAEARAALGGKKDLAPDEARALAFLSGRRAPAGGSAPFRTRLPGWSPAGAGPGPFGYEDVLPFVYQTIEPGHPSLLRALEALRTRYALDRNPDLTARYGPDGFLGGTEGLYYYYLLVAKALSTQGLPWIELASGERHDWVRELTAKLLSLQRPPGIWVNSDAHWWEDEPVLTTAYALRALRLCRAMR